MEYAQLNEAGTEALQITTHGNVEWDANNFCSAEALTRDGKAEQFRVVPLLVTEQPAFDAITQRCYRDGCELVGDQWQYKWTVESLSAEQIATNQAAAVQIFQAQVVSAAQARLDDFAKTRNYDGILSACTYASSGVPKFAAEGQYAVNARDATWNTLYTVMAEVQNSTRPMPGSVAEVMTLLPVMAWPE